MMKFIALEIQREDVKDINMSGSKSGVATRFKDLFEKCLFIH